MKFFLLLSILALFGCKNESEIKPNSKLSADEIIQKSIEVSGGDKFSNSTIDFEFRNKRYVAKRNNGKFLLMRVTIENKTDSIFDILTNDGFERFENDELITLKDSIKTKYAASVNSVHYFSVLPYGLNDSAVNKKLLGKEQIKGKSYYKIQVTFNENGGGEDFEDIFIYWINKETFEPDYLAYSYNEADGKGMRFREAYNVRYINSLRFVDYNNYKPKNDSESLEDLAQLFEKGHLEMVSKIELENVSVEILDF